MSSTTPATLTENTIYLVRHGESMGNVERLFLSAEDDILSPNGEKQVELLGKHLSEIKFHRMYCSDFPRAIDTARSIQVESVDSDSDAVIQTDARLRERDYGSLLGLTYKDGFQQFQLANVPILEYEVLEGETVSDVVTRMGRFMQELCEELDENEEPENVLVVSHSFAIVSFLHWLSKSEDYIMVDWSVENDFKMLGNACYMKIEVERKIGIQMSPRTLKFLSTNESSHLEVLLNESSGNFSSFTQANEEAKQFRGCVQQ